jgi:dolichol-phosphate hexosyltransferase
VAAPELTILMPVFDEARTVERAIDSVAAMDLPVDFELIVVDDGSTDGTSQILDSSDLPERTRVVRHDVNRGKGAAVRTGLAQARGRFSAIFDADLEYDPADLPVLLAPLLEGQARAAFGVRAFDGYTSHSFLYVMGNRAVTLAANLLFNVYLRDLMTGQKVVETELFRSLPLRAEGFSIEPEIAARLIQRGVRIFEVPVRYRARSTEEGKKLTGADGLRVLGTLVRCRLTPA